MRTRLPQRNMNDMADRQFSTRTSDCILSAPKCNVLPSTRHMSSHWQNKSACPGVCVANSHSNGASILNGSNSLALDTARRAASSISAQRFRARAARFARVRNRKQGRRQHGYP